MDIEVFASGSSGNAYRISDGDTALLLDAGIPIKALRVKCGFSLSRLDGCLITHCHADHSKAAKDLARAGVDIYTSAGTIAACGLSGHRIKPVKAITPFTVGSFVVLPFDVQHDAPEPLGFLIESKRTDEKLVYFTDTYYLKYRFTGLTHIMAECNHDKQSIERAVREEYTPVERLARLYKSHMSLEHLQEVLAANDLSAVKQIYLLHLSANNSDAERYRRVIQEQTGVEVYVCGGGTNE